jgi:phospholipase C
VVFHIFREDLDIYTYIVKLYGVILYYIVYVSHFVWAAPRSVTCDMNHGYTDEQNATNGGLMNKFVNYTSPSNRFCTDPDRLKRVMGYFDGNTVTEL